MIKKNIIRHISNIPGKRINRKILVLESDDWGSIRMPSKQACDTLHNEGIPVYDNFFSANDGLESNQDLEALFETLNSVKDSRGNPAVMTPLTIMANPDFEAIEKNSFTKYVYEPFTVTAEKYKGSNKLLSLWKQGRAEKLFVPEFHGREHLNVKRWMKGLQDDLSETRRLFKLKMYGVHSSMVSEKRKEYFPAFDIDKLDDIENLKEVLKDGIELFKKMLDYNPHYIVPPNGPFNNELQPFVKSMGLKYINSAKIQQEPLGDGKFRKKINYLGKKSKSGLFYITRNVIFEPSKPTFDSWVNSALKDVNIAFKWHKPAIISSHRVNYVSRISEKNRENGLKDLKLFLQQVLKKWPDVEFMSSSKFGDIISKTNKF